MVVTQEFAAVKGAEELATQQVKQLEEQAAQIATAVAGVETIVHGTSAVFVGRGGCVHCTDCFCLRIRRPCS